MKPLEDIRVIAVEQYGAGPFGSLHLADLGAEVIKIEDPKHGGDVGRYVPPFQEGEDSLFFETFNRNKKSISLNIRNAAGRQVFEDLLATADALYSNLRGDVPEKLKLRYHDVMHVNEKLVCVSISGFGMTGPLAGEPGYDYIVQGLAGWMSLTGEPGGPPTKTGLSLVDFTGGYVGAMALLAGVHAARRDGVGMDCDISLYDTAVTLLTYPAVWHLNEAWTPTRTDRSAHPSLVPFQLFRGADSEWFVVACAKEKFFKRLTEVIGRPDLATDERFRTFSDRAENKGALIAILDDLFSSRPAAEWIETLKSVSVPTGLVQSVASALSDAHTLARGLIVSSEHERFGTVKSLASPVRVGTTPADHRRAPHRNEHGPEILRDLLGYGISQIDALESEGAFGEPHDP